MVDRGGVDEGLEEGLDGTAPLEAVRAAKAAALDAARPEAVARRHRRGAWTARERLDALCDPGSFVEYGRLVRPQDRSLDGPADGLVMGHATVDGSPVCVMSYDVTVHAGTQSPRNHRKIDRMLDLAARWRRPVVIWVEGGGARPQELRYETPIRTLVSFARLSGLVPTVAVATGRAFAGNAAIAGTVDCTIATGDACLGMAGPALVEAATGERRTPEEIGSAAVHERSGAVDLVVEGEEAAVRAVRHYLSFFTGSPPAQGPGPDATAVPDSSTLRDVIPANPRRAYDVRDVVTRLVDERSMLELRPRFAANLVTALARLGGRPVGIVANQPKVLAGALDAHAADKAARFVRLCDAHEVALLFLCDTPGFMVGPAAEATALVRHSARIGLALADATVPVMTVVLRKAYGFGYHAMGSDAFDPAVLVAWPTAELGGMAMEGAVSIMYADELAAAPDPEARAALHAQRTAELRARNSGLAYARGFLLDDVVDPAETRDLLLATLAAQQPPAPRTARKHPVDAW